MALTPYDLDVIAALVGVCLLYRLLMTGGPPLPPGPRGLPFLGSALDWPTSRTWRTYRHWGDIYGNNPDLFWSSKFEDD
jgi:hypothetical protein